MIKNKNVFYLIIGVTLLLGCNNNENSTNEKEKESVSENHEEVNSEKLILNNGKKWKVNDEMMPYIIKSEQLVEDFDGEDYKAFTDDLLELNNKLISSCTMDGASHDELHKWLHPHIELLKQLKAQANHKSVQGIVEEIEDSFKVFHTYFK